jgi:hypothetical protein
MLISGKAELKDRLSLYMGEPSQPNNKKIYWYKIFLCLQNLYPRLYHCNSSFFSKLSKMLQTLGLAALLLASPFNAVSASCYGLNACLEGWVWRQAIPTDYVCVTPAVRTQTAKDNVAGPSHEAVGSPFDFESCAIGYVWREAYPNDQVCVLPATRQQAANNNAQAPNRVASLNLTVSVWEDYGAVTPPSPFVLLVTTTSTTALFRLQFLIAMVSLRELPMALRLRRIWLLGAIRSLSLYAFTVEVGPFLDDETTKKKDSKFS